MADQIILDAGQDPGTQAATVAAQAIGAKGWMAFSGGRSLIFQPWSATTVQGLMVNGFGILPVYAMGTPLTQAQGFGDGITAASEWLTWGIQPGSLGMLDVEPDFYNQNPSGTLVYANAWQAAVQQAGYLSCMYGLANFIDAFQSTPPSADAVIVANYPRPQQLWGPPSTTDIPSAQASWPAARGWQYTNEVMVGPVNCDVSVINFALAGGDPLDPQTLAALQAFLADYNNPDWGLHRVFYGATDAQGVYHPGLVVEEQDLETRAQQVQDALVKLQPQPVDVPTLGAAVAAALAGNQAFIAAIASAVAHEAGKALESAP